MDKYEQFLYCWLSKDHSHLGLNELAWAELAHQLRTMLPAALEHCKVAEHLTSLEKTAAVVQVLETVLVQVKDAILPRDIENTADKKHDEVRRVAQDFH